MPQVWLNATANKGSTLKIAASATTVTQQYAIGNFPVGWQVGGLAPNLSTSSLVWQPGAPNPTLPNPPNTSAALTALPGSVPQTFSVNNVALLQYFGGVGPAPGATTEDCAINNTSVNSLMVAGGGYTTLVGGLGSNELLGGPGVSQLIGRGTVDYLLANYTVNYTGVALGANGVLTAITPVSNGNYIYGWPASEVFVLAQNGTQKITTNAAKAFLPSSAGLGLTPTEWLMAVFYTPASILKLAQMAPMLQLLPGCPNETLFV